MNDWLPIYACVSCDKQISWDDKMHSDGVCHKCGHFSRGTICDTTLVVYKKRLISPWWRFWNKQYLYGARDMTSYTWLRKHKDHTFLFADDAAKWPDKTTSILNANLS